MQARRAVVDWAREHVGDRAVLSDIALAITEATTNVVLHAYRDRAVPGSLSINARSYHDHLWFSVLDEGSAPPRRAPRLSPGGPEGGGLAPRVGSRGLGLGRGVSALVEVSGEARRPETG